MDTRVRRLWGRGYNTAEIARKTNQDEWDVDNEVHKILTARYEKGQYKPCLMCLKKFDSDGPKNRVCKKCKTSEMWG